MFILLLTLLGIALIITCAGLWLSAGKGNVPTQREDIEHLNRQLVATRNVRRTIEIDDAPPVRRSRGAAVQLNYSTTTTRLPAVTQTTRLPSSTTRLPVTRTRATSAMARTPRRTAGVLAVSVNAGTWLPWQKPSSWLGILLILMALSGFGLFSLKALSINPGLVINTWLSDVPATATSVAQQKPVPTADPLIGVSGASKALVRLYQIDRNQYASQAEFDTWAYSACSAASMTEVINSYGNHYRITDILKVEVERNAISAALGLLDPKGIDRTVDAFGFKTIWLDKPSLDAVIKVANDGRPVIVNWPPHLWAGGHLLVLRGGNDQNVFLADSSGYNYTTMSRARFMQLWVGFAAVVVPK
jgi:hypothetical protein